MSNCSPCSTVLGVLTNELRESMAFKKEFRTPSITVQKRVLLLCYLLCHIYNRVLCVLPLFSTNPFAIIAAYVRGSSSENVENSRTLRTQALSEFDGESWEAISSGANCYGFSLCERSGESREIRFYYRLWGV
jgi:hypothetical protein